MNRRDYGVTGELRKKVARELAEGGPSGIARVETVIPYTDPLAWLRAQHTSAARLYWTDRDGAHAVAGVGAADRVACADADAIDRLFGQVGRRLEGADPGARYFGGLRFSGSAPADAAWREFGNHGFVLPRFELRRTGSDSVLACQWLRSTATADGLMAELDALDFTSGENGPAHFAVTGRHDLPGRAAWNAAVSETLDLVSKGDLGKVVLARKSSFGFADRVDPLACLQALLPETERCYRFCFVPAAGKGFVGASPERLYRREGKRVLCDAVAGTRTRGDGASLDRRLEQDLVESAKERREQDYVVRGIRESLAPLCRALNAGADPSVMKLRNWQHLMSRFEGVLHDGVGDAELLRALHPTPAVGGYPTGRALREIERREPFDRGWYAGPVGWVGHDGAEFAVAIRSALVEGDTLSVFSGAGIVAGSVPEDEWAELEHKIRHFTRALNLPG